MMLPGPALSLVHIVAGGAALILGPIAMVAAKRRGLHTKTGFLFFIAVTAVCVSGGWLAVIHWDTRAFFLFISIGTQAFALLGYVAARRRWPRWLIAHVIGQGSAYTAMVTAFIVANWDNVTGVEGTEEPLVFLVPMAVGTLAVSWAAYQVHCGIRPRLTS